VQNYLYCFDENYNIQATCSIFSLLSNNSESVNIFVIHKNPDTFKKYVKKLKKLKNLNELNISKFDSSKKIFPNIKNTHVSEATYYRFYLDEYLPNDLSEIMYIDADIICINDMTNSYYDSVKKLNKDGFIISARTEKYKKNNETLTKQKTDFERLGLKGSKYFNAGVMLISLSKWKSNNTKESILINQAIIEDKILFWDQDVLNYSFDGKYSELDKNLNFDISINVNKNMEVINLDESLKLDLANVKLMHYSGKSKPWSVKGVIHPLSKYYHEVYAKIFLTKYHIQNNWKKLALKHFLIVVFKRRLENIKYPFSFFLTFLRYVIK
jgi:UDP-glucose:(galactosyl)LPS alpha-1,2-glucosyltransferase